MKVHVTGRRAGLYWFICIHPWHTVLSSGDVSSTVHEPQVKQSTIETAYPKMKKQENIENIEKKSFQNCILYK